MISRKYQLITMLSVLLIFFSLVSAASADTIDTAVTPVVYEKTGNVSSGSEPSFDITDGSYTLFYYWKMSPTRTTYRLYAADLTVNSSGIYENGTAYAAPTDFSELTLRCDEGDLRLDGIYENINAIEETVLPEGNVQKLSLTTPVSNNNTWFLMNSPAILYMNLDTEETDLDCQVIIETLVLGDTETTITVSGENGCQTKTFTPSDKEVLSGTYDTSTGGDKQYYPQKLFYRTMFSGIVSGTYDVTVTGKDASGNTVSATETLHLGAEPVGDSYRFWLQYEKDNIDRSAWYAGTGENASDALKNALTDAGIECDITYGAYGPSVNSIDGLETTDASGSWVWWNQYHLEDDEWIVNDMGLDSYPDVFTYALVYGDGSIDPTARISEYSFWLQYEKDNIDRSAWYTGTGVNASDALKCALTDAGIEYNITYGSFGPSINIIDGLEMSNASGSWIWWGQYHLEEGDWIVNDMGFDSYPDVFTYALVYGDGSIDPTAQISEYRFWLQYEKDGIDRSAWYEGSGNNASAALINALNEAGIECNITYGAYTSINSIDGLEMTNASGSWVWWSQYHMEDNEWITNDMGFDSYDDIFTYALVYGDGSIDPTSQISEYSFWLQYEKDGVDRSAWYEGSGNNASAALRNALNEAGIECNITYGAYTSINSIDGLEMTNASGSWVWWSQYHMEDNEWISNDMGFDSYDDVFTYALVYGDGSIDPESSSVLIYAPGEVKNARLPENQTVSDGSCKVSMTRAASADAVFAGWDLNGSFVAPGDSLEISGKAILVAQWIALENGFIPTGNDVQALNNIIIYDGAYDSRYDLNKDGELDIFDLVYMAQYVADN